MFWEQPDRCYCLSFPGTRLTILDQTVESSTKPSPAPDVSTQVMALNDTDGFEAFDDARENYRECAHANGCSHASAIRCAGSDAGKRNSASKLSHDT
jgi:hypothetical protein